MRARTSVSRACGSTPFILADYAARRTMPKRSGRATLVFTFLRRIELTLSISIRHSLGSHSCGAQNDRPLAFSLTIIGTRPSATTEIEGRTGRPTSEGGCFDFQSSAAITVAEVPAEERLCSTTASECRFAFSRSWFARLAEFRLWGLLVAQRYGPLIRVAPDVSPTLQYASSLEIQAEQRTETVKPF
jgi:hypothetical protein